MTRGRADHRLAAICRPRPLPLAAAPQRTACACCTLPSPSRSRPRQAAARQGRRTRAWPCTARGEETILGSPRSAPACAHWCQSLEEPVEEVFSRKSACSASSDKACAVPRGPRSMRAFAMDLVRLPTGAPWPRGVLSLAISRWSGYAQAYSILSEYPAIWDIATSVSLKTLLGILLTEK
jgi:hypothetical protein